MVFDKDGRKRGHRFQRGLMRSAAKLSYEEAQAAIDGRPDERALALEASRLGDLGGPLVRVRETDGPYAGQLTALGLRIGRKEVVGRFVSSIPKLK